MQASVQQPPQIEDARRALPDRSLGYSFSGTFDSNGGLQCQQFLTSALGVCAQHVRACSFSVCVSNRRPAIHDVGCWFCLYVRYSLLWCTLSLCAAHGGGKCGFVGCAWAQRVFGAAESSADALSVSAKCVLKRVCSACVLMHISFCAQCKYVLSWWLCVCSALRGQLSSSVPVSYFDCIVQIIMPRAARSATG